MQRKKMPISRGWFQGALITYLIGFAILGILAYLTYAKQPPIPEPGTICFLCLNAVRYPNLKRVAPDSEFPTQLYTFEGPEEA